MPPAFIDVQRKLVDALMRMPVIDDFAGRSSLLQGLPPAPLVRSAAVARLDLNNIVSGLQQMGRLTDQGGARPVIVVVDNALAYLPPQSEIAQALNEAKRELVQFYGGEYQPQLPPAPAETLEALIFGQQRDTRLQFSFVEQARRAARSVTRLTVPRLFDGLPDGVTYGTGWLIAPGVVITNHHVIDARDKQQGEPDAAPADFQAQAQQVEAWFDHTQEIGGNPLKCTGARLLDSDKTLDYTIIELTEASKVADRPPLRLIRQAPALARGSRMNLVQHAKGGPLQYAIRNNFFVRTGETPDSLLYQTDTEQGASGSPVCDDRWQVVGLHRASREVAPETVPQEVIGGQPVEVKMLNEATAIHAVLNHLPNDLRARIWQQQPTGVSATGVSATIVSTTG